MDKKHTLKSLIDLDNTDISDMRLSPLPKIDVVKELNELADQWVSTNALSIDEDSEECLSHYLESQGEDIQVSMLDIIANNAFYRAGL